MTSYAPGNRTNPKVLNTKNGIDNLEAIKMKKVLLVEMLSCLLIAPAIASATVVNERKAGGVAVAKGIEVISCGLIYHGFTMKEA